MRYRSKRRSSKVHREERADAGVGSCERRGVERNLPYFVGAVSVLDFRLFAGVESVMPDGVVSCVT